MNQKSFLMKLNILHGRIQDSHIYAKMIRIQYSHKWAKSLTGGKNTFVPF